MASAQVPVQVIVGLGNPGPEYEPTRHNAGFWFVDELARRHHGVFREETKFKAWVCRVRIADHEIWLLKPSHYMNRSGQSVLTFAHFYKIPVENMIIAHDELDLPPGVLRLKRGGGHGGHNGLRDLIEKLSSKDFMRLRIGIGHPGHKDQVHNYVLGRPSKEDGEEILLAIDDAIRETSMIVQGDFEKAMNVLHSRRPRNDST